MSIRCKRYVRNFTEKTTGVVMPGISASFHAPGFAGCTGTALDAASGTLCNDRSSRARSITEKPPGDKITGYGLVILRLSVYSVVRS